MKLQTVHKIYLVLNNYCCDCAPARPEVCLCLWCILQHGAAHTAVLCCSHCYLDCLLVFSASCIVHSLENCAFLGCCAASSGKKLPLLAVLLPRRAQFSATFQQKPEIIYTPLLYSVYFVLPENRLASLSLPDMEDPLHLTYCHTSLVLIFHFQITTCNKIVAIKLLFHGKLYLSSSKDRRTSPKPCFEVALWLTFWFLLH